MRLLLFALLCCAMSSTYSQTATLKGTIHSRPNQTVNFVYTEDPIHGYINVGKVTTDDSGNFVFRFKLDEKRPIQLNYNVSQSKDKPEDYMYNIWIEPGKTVVIDVISDTLIDYSGDCIDENRLLKTLNLNSFSKYVTKYDTTGFHFKALKQSLDAIKDQKTKLLSSHFSSTRFSPEYKTFISAEVFFEDFRNKFRYITEYTSQKNINVRKFSLPPEFTSFLKSINFYNDNAFHSLKFRNGLREYFDFISTTTLADNGESYTLHTFRLLDKRLSKLPRTKEFLKAYFLKFAFNYEQKIDTLKEAVAQIENQHPNSSSLTYFNKKLNEKVGLLYSKKSLPDILLTDTAGKRICLNELKGKILFIDFWGSWCKPCLEQMPFSKKLEKELEGENVLFVYINNPVDSYEKWKATIKKLGIEGLQLKADEEAQKELYDYYVFTNYPYYVVTNADGTPQNIEGGVRPSVNAKQVLEELLKK